MMHTFIIKDFFATPVSAVHIINNICTPLIKAIDKQDITCDKIYIVANDNSFYPTELDSRISVIGLGTKYEFADFHNISVSVIKEKNIKNNVHILSGGISLNINEFKPEAGEFSKAKTYIGAFLQNLMNLMDKLNRSLWFSTASDAANYAFGKYFTILDILNIDKKTDIEFPSCMMWAGNSNLDWIFINPEKQDISYIEFNNEYEYDFLSIKACIAKTVELPGYFINLFPTIPHEVGAFGRVPDYDLDRQEYDLSNETYNKNMALFAQNTQHELNVPKQIPDVVKYMKEIFSS